MSFETEVREEINRLWSTHIIPFAGKELPMRALVSEESLQALLTRDENGKLIISAEGIRDLEIQRQPGLTGQL